MFITIDGTIVKKKKHLLQISAWELHNDVKLKKSEGGFFGARTANRNVCIGDTSLSMYTPENI